MSLKSKVAQWAAVLRERIASCDFRISSFGTRVLLGLALVAALAGWLYERTERVEREGEIARLRQETGARARELEARAAEAAQAAQKRHARALLELESSRIELEHEAQRLRRRLAELERQEHVRVEHAATLPLNEIAKRVRSRLDPGALVREQGTGDREQERARDSGFGIQISAKESAMAPPSGALGTGEPDVTNLDAESRIPNPPFSLTEANLRQVEAAFIELESCREQAEVKDKLLANCQEHVGVEARAVVEIGASVEQLREAVRLKDEALARREAEHRTALKAARGSRWARFRRAVEYVALGMVIGVVATH